MNISLPGHKAKGPAPGGKPKPAVVRTEGEQPVEEERVSRPVVVMALGGSCVFVARGGVYF